jgi:hypothetical protein
MQVRRDKVMGPHFVGGQDVFTLPDDIPGGSAKRWGREGEGGAQFGIMVGGLIELLASVALYPVKVLLLTSQGCSD